MPCDTKFQSLSDEDIARIEISMKPDGLSQSGFINEGESLRKIYTDDKEKLETLGITYNQIADVLQYTYEKALTLNNPLEEIQFNNNNLQVSLIQYKGAQRCPFQKKHDKLYYGYEYGSIDVEVKSTITGEVLKYNTLLPHMIRNHQFFESPTVSHRVDPEYVINFFNIEKDKDYSLKYEEKKFWMQNGETNKLDKKLLDSIDLLEKISVNTYNPSDDIFIYIIPFDFDYIDSAPNLSYDENDTFESIRRKIILNYNHDTTDEKIFRKILNEQDLIQKYKEEGILITDKCKIHYVLINLNPSDNEFSFKIENMDLEIDSNVALSYGQVDVCKYVI